MLFGDSEPNDFGNFGLLAVEKKSYEEGLWAIYPEQKSFAGQKVESFASWTVSVGHLREAYTLLLHGLGDQTNGRYELQMISRHLVTNAMTQAIQER